MFFVDLHAHTTRCNHAVGTMREYLQKAVENGIKIYGFSEHAPLFLDDGVRMLHSQIEDYEGEIATLKEEFRGKIEVLKGYEADYLPEKMDLEFMKRDVDYFIGSVHYLHEWGFDNPEYIGEYAKKNLDSVWREYFEAVADMANSGMFDIVGHLDLIKLFGFFKERTVDDSVINALEAIKRSEMAMEINTAGKRKPVGEFYPSLAILKEAKAMNIPLTFGSDAHDPTVVGYGLKEAYEMAKSVGYKEAFYLKDRQKIGFKL